MSGDNCVVLTVLKGCAHPYTDLEGADGEDELAREVPELREEGVEEEGECQAQHRDAQPDRVRVHLHHRLNVNLRRQRSIALLKGHF